MILTQKAKPYYWEDIEAQLEAIFYTIVFEPVVDIIKKFTAQGKEFLNAKDEEVRKALREGRIQYSAGVFSGSFNAAISRGLRSLGADFDKRRKVFTLKPSAVPAWVSAEAGVYSTKSKAAHADLKKVLGYMESSLDQMVDKHTVRAHRTVERFEKDFQPIAAKIQVYPTLSHDSIERLSADYTENMKLWIQKFSEQEIEELRGIVESNAHEGYRFDRLIAKIEGRYGVAQSKAKFLARQETALFMSKFRQARFKEGGVTQYTWSTSHDERVRDDHKHLNGRVFSYSQPPVVDRATGRRANPGEDFNCRCVDIPVLRAMSEAA